MIDIVRLSRLPRYTTYILAALTLIMVRPHHAWAQAAVPEPILIDASTPTAPPAPANYKVDPVDAKSPSGQTLGLNAEYLTLDGKALLPVMGEMHYSRVPEADWETEILKMKSSGVQIISTYLIWIHHEEVEGQWDWSGNKDLRRFAQLCARHHMYLVVRVGPWSHAEVRNGGFPDWLLEKTKAVRSNDPTYLHDVDLYFQQIGQQLHGLMWSQGGPVIAVQLENEYNRRGPGRGNEHILKLKQMARDAGLRVPFYTVTGWDGAAIPRGEVLPVYGGYPDAPWDASLKKLPASEVYNFRFGSRVTGDMGAQTAAPRGNAANFTTDTPFMTAEMGGGMQITYHRRPVVSADDIAAMMPVMLGSGVNLYGTYMFHGGQNPDGKLTTLQESLATHSPNDLPVKTYDFEAPIGEYGQERESLLKLKSWNYFLNDFGPILAPMQPHRPSVMPAGPADLTVPRLSARTSGQSGFLFVNNHVRGYEMPARNGFQVTVKLPGNKSLSIPEKPTTVPADAYFVWPFNIDLGGLHLRYATAQPFAILGTPAAPIYTFFAQPGIAPEFVIDQASSLKTDPSLHPDRRDHALWFHDLTAGPDCVLHFTVRGHAVSILLLRQQDAEQSWKLTYGKTSQLVMTPQQAYIDGSTAVLQDLGSPDFSVRLLPSTGATLASPGPQVTLHQDGSWINASLKPKNPPHIELTPTLVHPAGNVTPLPPDFKPSNRPRVVAAAPTEADWSLAAVWALPIPKAIPTPDEKRFLRIQYLGDVARLSIDNHLLDDDFASGAPWLVGLTRYAPQLQSDKPLDLSIYPLRQNPPIFFEPGYVQPFKTPQSLDLQSVELLTEYSLRLSLNPAPPAILLSTKYTGRP